MSTCEVCEGSGEYPIINARGKELYCIRCPECWGDGRAQDVEADEPMLDLPPASTASKIKSIDELLAWQAKQGES